LAGEFAARAERAGWLMLHRELGARHRDDVRWLRPKRIGVGEVSVDPSYASSVPPPADVMRGALTELYATLSHTERPGAILLERCSQPVVGGPEQ
jgi:hypothetical protein